MSTVLAVVVPVVCVGSVAAFAYHVGFRHGWDAKTADLRRLNNRRQR